MTDASGPPSTDLFTPATFEEFGREFFTVAVTSERILAGIDVLAGEPINFGPIGVGPRADRQSKRPGRDQESPSHPRRRRGHRVPD